MNEKESGCDFCAGKDSLKDSGFEMKMDLNELYVEDVDWNRTSFFVHYCPMCGRKVEEPRMTEREICERIIKDGFCYAITCNGDSWFNEGTPCPFNNGDEFDCLGRNPVDVAKEWLEAHGEGST